MSFRRSAAALVALAAVSFAPSARAFCRTITLPLPADYDPQKGCYEPNGSIPLWWRNACVGFSVQQDASKQVSLADARAHLQTAFDKWSGAACPSGGSPSIKAVDEGPVACDQVQYSEQGPNQHAIIFRDVTWPHDDPNNTLALTTVTFDKNTGELYDADMEINTADSTVVVSGPVSASAFDFDSIVTHETGHFLGLAHTPDTTAIMFAHYQQHSVTLKADDVDGICSVYAPNGERATSLAASPTTVAEDACDPTPRHGYGSACGPLGAAPTTTSSHCAVGSPGAGGSGDGIFALGAIAAALAAARRRGATLRRMRSRLRGFALTALLALGAGGLATTLGERDARASVSIAVMLDELVRDSTAAAVMTPMEQKAVWENGRIYTYTRVHVDRVVAGQADEEIWVRTMGGVVGDVGQLVDGEAVLTVGRPALLFVKPATEVAGIFVVTARAQGQFPVVLDEKKQPQLIHAAGTGALLQPPPARVALLAKQRAIAGITAAPRLASEALHKRAVDDAATEIAAAWSRIHASR